MASQVYAESILVFDGKDDHIDVGKTDLNGALAKGSSALTVLGWVKPKVLGAKASNHGTRNVFLAHASDEKNDNLEIGISPEGNLDVYFDENKDDVTKTYGKGELSAGSWHSFAVVFKQGRVTVYLDGSRYGGTLKGTSLDDSPSPVTIGATLHSDIFFSGQLVHLSVWNIACTKTQIDRHRIGLLTGKEKGLVAYWPLTQGTSKGNKILDQTANGHHGTLKGGLKWVESEVPNVFVPPEPEPPVEEPIVEEPIAEEPVAEEPVAEEPVAEPSPVVNASTEKTKEKVADTRTSTTETKEGFMEEMMNKLSVDEFMDSFAVDEVVKKIASLGLPGVLLLVTGAATGAAGGSAGLISVVTTLGGPLGVLGGLTLLGLVTGVGDILSGYGLEAVLNAVYQERKKNESVQSLRKEVEDLLISDTLRVSLLKALGPDISDSPEHEAVPREVEIVD